MTTLTTLTILSIIPILIICASLYFTNRRIDKMTNSMKELYSDLQQHELIINYALADDLREIKEHLDAYKLELCNHHAHDPKDQAN